MQDNKICRLSLLSSFSSYLFFLLGKSVIICISEPWGPWDNQFPFSVYPSLLSTALLFYLVWSNSLAGLSSTVYWPSRSFGAPVPTSFWWFFFLWQKGRWWSVQSSPFESPALSVHSPSHCRECPRVQEPILLLCCLTGQFSQRLHTVPNYK